MDRPRRSLRVAGRRGGGGPDSDLIQQHKRLLEKCQKPERENEGQRHQLEGIGGVPEVEGAEEVESGNAEELEGEGGGAGEQEMGSESGDSEEMEEGENSEEEEPTASTSSRPNLRSSKRRDSLLHSSSSTKSSPISQRDHSDLTDSREEPRQLKIHAVDNSKPEGFFCLCSLQFSSKANLTSHIKYFIADPKFKCDYCSLRFLQLSVMKKHMWRAHQKRFLSGTIGCGDCGEVFKIPELHMAHRLKYHPKENEDLHKSHAMDKKAGRNVWKCTCGKIFAKEKRLRNHLHLRAKNVDWKCNICDRSYKTNSLLQVHTRNVHQAGVSQNIKKIGCSVCGETFPSTKPFQEHMHRIHGIITWRQQEATTTSTLIRPGRFHGIPKSSSGRSSEEKIFRCLCGSEFPTKKELTAHISKNRVYAHFKCSVCEVKFLNHSKLKTHMIKIHDKKYNGFGCTYCGTVHKTKVALCQHRQSEHNM